MANAGRIMPRIKKGFLYMFIGFLCLGALFAIACVLSGEFGEFEFKVIATTFVIAGMSICALCCGAHSTQGSSRAPGVLGMMVSIVTAAMLIGGIWAEVDSEEYWKTAAILGVFSVAFAHTLAQLLVAMPASHRWLQYGTAAVVFILAGLIATMIVAEDADESGIKLLVVLAILAALGTLVVPIMGKVARTGSGPAEVRLCLTRREDGIYEDKQGALFEVNPLAHSPAEIAAEPAE